MIHNYFWDNNVGASLFCQRLGFESGTIKKKHLRLPSGGLRVGRCNAGDKLFQCSDPKCNQLEIGGKCNGNSHALCTKGKSAAVSINCFGSGTSLNLSNIYWVSPYQDKVYL